MRSIFYRLPLLLLHALIGWVCLRLAFEVRFYLGPTPPAYEQMMSMALPLAFISKALAAEVSGLTRSIWRYAAFLDIRRVFTATVLGTGVLMAGILYLVPGRFPFGPLLLDFLFTFGCFAGVRFSGRTWFEFRKRITDARSRKRQPVLIVGAGDAGELAMRHLRYAVNPPVRLVGFLDDDPSKQGRSLNGVPVLGGSGDLVSMITKHGIREVIFALPNAQKAERRALLSAAVDAGCRAGILPELEARGRGGAVHHNVIRDIRLDDFLGRDPVQLDSVPVRASLSGLTVLVTGAGGSIGSELCRQISRFPVKELLLLDMAENALFEIHEEIAALPDAPPHRHLLCDIRRAEDVEKLMRELSPDVLFHAAACKHVPMMEVHPLEAVRTNVLGTRNIIQSALHAGVQRVLHVSTDKAVEACGIMGASKALSEQLVLEAGRARGLSCNCVRFGNVLGSNGSVIRLFEKQLQRGGPLNVTHKDATRYFMTIEEAVTLMLHAESLQGSGEIYTLDMGEPVSILRIAEQMLQLYGRSDRDDGGIEIIGLRPGERVHEKLLSGGQTLEPTSVPKVNRLVWHPGSTPEEELSETMARLERAVEQSSHTDIRKILNLIPSPSPHH